MTEHGDRVALVTGAAQGIGRAIAALLVRSGARVAMLDVDLDGARLAADELDASGARAHALGADVADPAQVQAALASLESHWRLPDILVNNAAVTISRPVWEIDVPEWDRVMATNLRSCLLFSQACAPAMRRAGWGRIVNMASMAGQQGGAVAGAHYAASKAGIIVLTKILARELAGDGVTVNAVAPAAIRTPAMDALEPERVEQLQRTIPVQRVGTADEVAAAVQYLCSASAAFVTGTTLDVNGGIFMR